MRRSRSGSAGQRSTPSSPWRSSTTRCSTASASGSTPASASHPSSRVFDVISALSARNYAEITYASCVATVADHVISALRLSGVRRVYGLPGDSLNGFTDALRRSGEISWEQVRHEETAAFAAAADAALTGALAVCAGSCGPGNLHLINGLYDAHRSRVPVLAIAAHIPRTEIGSEYF